MCSTSEVTTSLVSIYIYIQPLGHTSRIIHKSRRLIAVVGIWQQPEIVEALYGRGVLRGEEFRSWRLYLMCIAVLFEVRAEARLIDSFFSFFRRMRCFWLARERVGRQISAAPLFCGCETSANRISRRLCRRGLKRGLNGVLTAMLSNVTRLGDKSCVAAVWWILCEKKKIYINFRHSPVIEVPNK